MRNYDFLYSKNSSEKFLSPCGEEVVVTLDYGAED